MADKSQDEGPFLVHGPAVSSMLQHECCAPLSAVKYLGPQLPVAAAWVSDYSALVFSYSACMVVVLQ